MLRQGGLKVPAGGYGNTSPSLQGLAIITEGKSLQNLDNIPDISIDESYLTQSARKKQGVAHGPHGLKIPSESLCGARIAVYRHSGTSRSQRKSIATIGGVFRIRDRFFALTAAHVFFDISQNTESWADSRQFAIDDSDDTAHHDSSPSKIAQTYEVVIENYWQNAADPDAHKKPTNISIGLVAPSVLRRRQRPDSEILPEVIWDDKLDWALIELMDPAFRQSNRLNLTHTKTLEMKPPSYDQKAPSTDVIIISGANGAVRGRGLGSIGGLKMPWAKSEIRAWTVESELDPGGCGAMVINPDDGTVYGMVIAYDPETSVAHLIPGPVIYESILSRYDEETLNLNEMFLICSPSTSASTLAESETAEEYQRAPVVRSPETNIWSMFMSNLKTWSMQSIDGRRYIRRTGLTQWLLSECRDCISNVDFMLDDAYPRNEMLPITSSQLSGGEETSLLVFALLFELGQGKLIHHFIRQGITDRRLPLDMNLLDKVVERMGISDPEAIAKQFYDAQWAYCPMQFDLEMERDIPSNMIVPVHKRQQINAKGGSATLWKVTVLEEFVSRRLQAASEKARFNDLSDKLGHRYHFATKSSPKHHFAHFQSEVAAFKAFRSIPNMIGYLGNYNQKLPLPKQRAPSFSVSNDKKQEQGEEETNNILLEYGDFDLDEYFAATPPPVIPMQITQFWQDISGIAEAISEIHQFSKQRAGTKQEYSGWHADIKPDNILNVKGSFKIADPGFARFEKSEKKLTRLTGGTKTFGSPEVYAAQRLRDNPVSQSIDIWSLGCVLSVAATWVILGWSGVTQFQQLRMEALKRLSSRGSDLHRSRSRSLSVGRNSRPSFDGGRGPPLPEGDCFHDGKTLLKEVRHWHTFLRSVTRRSDDVTSQILDLVEEKMLVAKPEERTNALDLYSQMRVIVHSSESSNHDSTPDIVSQILLETEMETETGNREGSQSVSERRRPSALTISSAKTDVGSGSPNFKSSARSLFPSSPAPPINSGVSIGLEDSSSNDDDNRSTSPAPKPGRPFRNIVFNETGGRSVSSSIDIPYASVKPEKSKKSGLAHARRMSVSQARTEVDKKKMKVFSRRRKDPFLVKHMEDRDIEFLIDNGDTMRKHWTEMKELVDILCAMVAHVDKDGFDLSFTNGPVKLTQKSSSKAVKSTMDNDKAKPVSGTRTDMSAALDRVLGQYSARLKAARSSKTSRAKNSNYTLIVLTDGLWRGMDTPHSVEDTIIRRVNEIARHEGPKRQARQVTIQFIQFGADAEATSRLEVLDRGLIDYEIPDIIDTEPSDGNVWKMLLGSVEATFDYADD